MQSVNINGTDDGEALVIDGAGRILIAGSVNTQKDFGVARLTTAGALDNTFDTDGKQTVDFAGGTATERCETMWVQTSGEILLAGSSVTGSTSHDIAVARLSGGTVRHYAVQDANFNVTAVTDRYGTAVERYQYENYGAVTVLNADFSVDSDSISDINWKILHQGGAREVSTGLYHFRNRDYSPTLGRWVQEDPLGYVDGLSLYQYTGTNPVIARDPSGLEMSGMDFVDPSDPPPYDPPGPGIGDQWNPGQATTGTEDYRAWFEYRFPKTVDGAIELLHQRIIDAACAQFDNPSQLPDLTGKQDTVDITDTDMKRFGDTPQGPWEKHVLIGKFQFKAENIQLEWSENGCCFGYTATVYIEEQTGADKPGSGTNWLYDLLYYTTFFDKRVVRMAEWQISGDACCDDD